MSGQSQHSSGTLYRKRQPLGEITNTYRVKNGCSDIKHVKQALYFPHPSEIQKNCYPAAHFTQPLGLQIHQQDENAYGPRAHHIPIGQHM
jgi:hypothetical protein